MEKGKTNNPNGRPKGKPNKLTTETRQWLSGLIEKNRKQIERDLKILDPKDRLLILEKLMSYTVPKVSSMNLSFEQWSENQLDILISEITQSIENNDNQD